MNAVNDRKVINEELINISFEELGDLKPDKSNRVDKDNRNHIKRLRKSMRLHGYSRQEPIIVGSDLVIREGHHRYFAAQEEGIGVWIKIDDEHDIQTISQIKDIRKPWSSKSWIKKYANEGKGDFPAIQAFMDRYGFTLKVTLMILSDTANECCSNMFDSIKYGTFEVKDWQTAHDKAGQIMEFLPFFMHPKDVNNVYFGAAILKCLKTEGYDHDKMVKKVQAQTMRLRLQRNRRDTLEMLEEIYNFKCMQATRINLTKNL